MEMLTILYQLIFMPLQLLFEEIYYLIGWKLTKDYGLAIIVLSLTVNLLVLPLYNRADAVQEAEREIDAKLRKGVEHIKKTFKGDEQLMMLQTYYRQNNYSPLDAIKGSISLFLEIPFFLAAYQFLSHLSVLQGASLGPIKDLSQPDALLQIAGMTINVMPLIMTVVNIAATALFVTDMTTKTKIQLYGLAFFFLVFLYKSPAGLVFYWTLNNLFNLCKTLVYKFWKPKQTEADEKQLSQTKYFLAGAVFMSILTGLLIPSSVISASADEFILKGYVDNPMWYLVSSFALAIGSFVLWLGVFYWLATPKGKVRYECFIGGFSIAAIATYMIWGQGGGLVTPLLKLTGGLHNTRMDRAINGVCVVALGITLHFIWEKYRKYFYEALCIGSVAILGMSCLNIMHIHESLVNIIGGPKHYNDSSDSNKIVLSKNGKNVIVLMLDGAQGAYVPYIMQEKPELKEAFSGFVNYENSISYGGHTLFGSPGLFGGYEYIPINMQKRSDQLLKEKHNEAMLMLPRIFHDNGFEVTLSAPPLLNYQSIPDYSVLKDYPYMRPENFTVPDQDINSQEEYLDMVEKNKRNFFCYSLVKTVPVVMQVAIYDYGSYNRFDRIKDQSIRSEYKADSVSKTFIGHYRAFEELSSKTRIKETGNTYLAMDSDISRYASLLQMPNYEPKEKVDNTGLVDFNAPCYIYKGRKLHMDTAGQVSNYHINIATFIKLGEWFKYLKERGVYDNTRIIIASDHGMPSGQLQELNFSTKVKEIKKKEGNMGDATAYHCLLMVKDFNKHEFTSSEEFMTNADVPTMALADIVANPINPFTNNPINTDAKNESEQFIIESQAFTFRHNAGNQFAAARWYGIKKNIWDKNNWRLVKEESITPN